jgi:multidrug resistance efflux pump
MRFQQSGFRPYDPECAVLPPVKTRSVRRLWLIRPRTILFAIGGIVVAVFGVDRTWVRGNGIVAGELTAVSPILQARLQHLFVRCLDHVTRGQTLAEFTNEATVQFAAQQLQQLQLQLTQARAGIEITEQQAHAARKLVEAQEALWKQQIAILDAETELLKHHYVADLVWQQAKAAVDRADAETRAAEFVYEIKMADQRKAQLDVEVLQKRIDSFVASPELTGHFYVTAPKDGVVTECTAREGEVIAARTPIFSIFNPNDTYAVVFFDPSAITKVAAGQSFKITIEGISEPVTGTVTDFYPELSALPSSLTRYFWQREMWSQYAPVRIDFTNLDAVQRSRLLAWAQLSASRFHGWGAANATTALSVSWQWVEQHLNWAWQFVAASFAQPPRTNDGNRETGSETRRNRRG